MNLTIKNYYWRWSKNLFLLLFFWLILMSLARLGFTWFFGDLPRLLQDLGLSQRVLWLGVRFDLILLSYLNIFPFIILNLAYLAAAKVSVKLVRSLLVNYLFLGYVGLFWLYVSDYGFYSFFQDRLNILFFGFLEDDTQALLTSIWKNYNVPIWLSLIAIGHYGLWRLVKIMFSRYDFDLEPRRINWRLGSSVFLGAAFIFLGTRGLSLDKRPLSILEAQVSDDRFINIVALNGGITFAQAIKARRQFEHEQVDFLKFNEFENWQQAFLASQGKKPTSTNLIDSLIRKTPEQPALKERPPHVVLVISEGVGSYWNDLNSRSFNILGGLQQHFKQDILFKNFLPSDNGTIGSFLSLAMSQVLRPGAPFLSQSNHFDYPLESSGHRPYQAAGYETHFVYGGHLGWRSLGDYMKKQGYHHTWGDAEIKGVNQELTIIESQDLGHEWGLFDEHIYTFIEERLRVAVKPQFFLVLTTSNHPPFEVPSTYRPLPLELPHEVTDNILVNRDLTVKRFLGLQYANQKFSEFLDRLKATRLKDNTIVGYTGDHSYWVAKNIGYDQEFKRYAVPFYLMVPEHLKPKSIDIEKFGSHEDIFPTLYHLSLSQQSYIKIGKNLWLDDSAAINSSGLVANKHGAFHSGRYWKWKNLKQQLLEPSEETPQLQKLKLYRDALITITDLYLKEEKTGKQNVSASDRLK
jgi:phosphoglycerol transferase MdoB-like AlkP superfamily enzyme